MESKEFHQKNFDRISKEASEMAEIILLNNGIQAKVFNTKCILTFYYRTKKYHLNISGAMVCFTPGKELKVIDKYFKKLNHVTNYMQNTPEFVALPINKKPQNNIIELTDKGTVACIEHIKRKIEIFRKIHPDKEGSQTLAVLINLTMELTQYI